MQVRTFTVVLSAALLAVAATGCATKKYVKEETGAVNTRVDQVQGQVEQAQTKLNDHDQRLSGHDQKIAATDQKVGEISKTAQDALQRAQEAGKLAEGKFLYETVLTDDKVKFGFNKKVLSPEAKSALDEFAVKLKAENKGVYVEVQGHTDNVGSAKYNEELGESRAEAVRVYLNQKQGFPLHRMNAISYGKTEPVADNKTRQGRAKNRRVVLVVLQ
ncbi:MAG TPA: OmpA family protein [Thermoanaerobaculia bacterium]|jgi:outer membrane protein OmpA-like peptidoglycan-associated protein|nr:OmpA family protein [Thermoanaerobaculia bacterium]